ncbi:DJ-1/PfpI family protein [Corynebacterium kroppenstedtii]|uniref:DJ-1/PfpI family protein n=1 Tax=Corynebacterium sp. PCR 32 TaxID=3351342 RepID=UPI0030B09E0F
MNEASTNRHLAIILFDQFEVLDVFGPAELFGLIPDVRIDYVGPNLEPVKANPGASVVPTAAYVDITDPDIILVPGGKGTRTLVGDKQFLRWLEQTGNKAQLVCSVCTGSAVLAAAGLLEGYRATSNKYSFSWASTFGKNVVWEAKSRWVSDRNRWTSSGVAAGMDMAAALIRDLFGEESHTSAIKRIEYEPQMNSSEDSFAPDHDRI